jgi:SAM-dependent methyltransferase
MMAADAAEHEAAEWTLAGIRPGARVADVGCGPGAVLRVVATLVGPAGSAVGVDSDESAVTTARREVVGLPHAVARMGSADATGLEQGTFDVVVCRHVLAHNGGHEPEIVRHLASLCRPGGAVLLTDVDYRALRFLSTEPDLEDLFDRYHAFQSARGNDLSVGIRLGELLEAAGLVLERHVCRSAVLRLAPGMRPPVFAAFDAMLDSGEISEDDVSRWSAAFARLDSAPRRPLLFPATFLAVGRRPAGASTPDW